MPTVQNQYKDRLFNFIFGSEEHKDWTLSLYNGAEVKDMLLTEYNEAEAMELFKEEGREEGRIEGLERGFSLLGALTRKLRELGRVDDAFRVMDDPAYRDKLISEFELA